MSKLDVVSSKETGDIGLDVTHSKTPEELLRKIISMPKPTKEEINEEARALPAGAQRLLNSVVKAVASHLSSLLGEGDDSTPNKLESHGRSLVRQAAKATKGRGTMPGYLQELIEEFLRPPAVPWTELLQMLIQRAYMTKKVRGMRRPSKLKAAVQMHMKRSTNPAESAMAQRISLFPGASTDPRFTVYFALDTSGSMGRDDLQAGLSELRHIQKSSPDMSIYVLYVDTHVCTEYKMGPNDDIDWNMLGRGGTDFEPAFVHIQQMLRTGRPADLLIYATDGYAPPPKTKLPIPTVWLLTAAGQPVMNEQGHTTLHMKSYTYDELSK